jgi:[acyl-carrier-protein] S-malonyltransferase
MRISSLLDRTSWKGWKAARGLSTHAPPVGTGRRRIFIRDDLAFAKPQAAELRKLIGSCALAFTGYGSTNLGRSGDLLAHPAYGPRVREVLKEASEICSETRGARVDLAARIEARAGWTLESLPEDVATVLAMEIVQIELMESFFGIPIREACLSFGFSLGEVSAVVVGGVFTMPQVLSLLLPFARDSIELARQTSLATLSTRGPALPLREAQRLCIIISSQGHGLIAPSAFLSPRTMLLLGQGDTLDRFEEGMGHFLGAKVVLRRHANQWPPFHTPLVRRLSLPNRLALALYRLAADLRRPSPPVVSCVTGEASYDELNSRELLIQWTDHPQRLWDVIQKTLAAPTDRVIHVGPEPTLIPTTFARLNRMVAGRLGTRTLDLLRHSVIPGTSHTAWLARLLPNEAASWRSPFIEHLILEEWLLEQPVP